MKTKISNKIIAIGVRVRNKRIEKGITIFNLAVDSECSLSVISELERGMSSGMTTATLIKIAYALEITPEELFNE